MAQVVYDQHPLGDYLKDEVGEQALSMTMPGGENPLSVETIETESSTQDVLEPLVSVLGLSRQTAHREFAERFIHAVILSPLLANTSPSSPPPNTSTLPHHPITLPTDESDISTVDPVHAWPVAAAILVLAAFLTSGFTVACVIALAAGLADVTGIAPEHHARRFLATACGKLRSSGWLGEWEDDPAPVMLAALDRCVQATSAWDAAVSDAIGLLETEEQSMFYTSSPAAPSPAVSALRVALTSELNAATNTTDTLRGLFAPLTQPAALGPLTAMYAPPTSPPPVRVRSHARYASIGTGPRSMDASPSPNLTSLENKRSTWGPGIGGGVRGGFSTGGNYGNLGLGRRRTSAHLRRSRLATPDRALHVPLPEDDDEDTDAPKVVSDIGEDSERVAPLPQFGSDSEAVSPRTPPRRTKSYMAPTPNSTFGSIALSSLRRVSHQNQIQTTSLAALRHALTVARASRRHTAAHLMALRFTDGDGEYWEDVRSVMGLLSAGLEDGAGRLGAAVENAQGNAAGAADSSFGSELGVGVMTPLSAGFAPTASPKERFGMHIEELAGATTRAKDVASTLSTLSFEADPDSSDAQLESIRRELGTALRQLERARAVLRQQRAKRDAEEDSDVPALDASRSSPASSEKGEGETDELTPLDAIHSNADILRRDSLGRDTLARSTLESSNVRQDDASDYLLLGTSAQHLPPPGIEQVFEADTDDMAGIVGAKRPKSTLSRAERIAAARTKREQKSSRSSISTDGENWGPGGDVVQELKAVISEVGVRRRRAATEAGKVSAPPSLDLSRTRGLSTSAGVSVEVDEV
ncbi:hypothetical protein RhiJN_01754 [Ceratobasidium sp. AG-Ba]|nr:hypothetical protein RhiJN_01754 [Ceratobasidium sp. AG-Ba]QRW02684.1 hypothetical protein RhiLY_01683 [Ceratobasidium sp. AG-Ba]